MSTLRNARAVDVPRLHPLIADSARALSAKDYSPEQVDALIKHVFGVDSQLIADRTYYVIERDGELLACGGWSKRRTLFGGDQTKREPDPLLDPRTDAARIRAFFVHPKAARQGFGRQLLAHCVAAAREAGFHMLELMATLPGERLYRAFGFKPTGAVEHKLPGGLTVRFVPMRMQL